MRKRKRRLLWKALWAALLAPLLAAGVLLQGWWNFRSREADITRKMDQYWLAVTASGPEEYLLEEDEVFEVPYMASRLSMAAAPTRILDAKGRLIGEFASEKGLYVRDPEDLPAFLKKALVAAEDWTFYKHGGVNFRAIGRAMLTNLKSLETRQGGSTLTQQLAKLLFTTRKRTYGRKAFEMLCARKLESKFTKDQILLLYLNLAYFGHGLYGVESASRFYFGKSAKDLELGEAAMLVGVIPNPTRYSPFVNSELARARHRTVLTRMAKLNFVPSGAVNRYSDEFWAAFEGRLRSPQVSYWRMRVNNSPYLVERVRRTLEKDFSKERILKGGLTVRTTFDLEIQKAAEIAVQEGLRMENAASTAAAAASPIEGGLAAVDLDGSVLALVGGESFRFSNQLDRSMDIARPIGSAVKPFIFAAAFESGKRGPEAVFDDHPLTFKLGRGKVWSPQNYGRKYFGKVTLASALRKSLNSVAIQLLQEQKLDAVIALLAEATGAPPENFPRNLSLALGTADLSPLQSATAYAAFANGGIAVRPHYLTAIEDRDGKLLRGEEYPAPHRILSTATAGVMTEVMKGVFTPEGTAHAAAAAAHFHIPAAGKTGTTSDYRDAWFSGYTPEFAASVWIGRDDMRVALGYGRTGGSAAAPIWIRFVKEVYKNRPTREFSAQ